MKSLGSPILGDPLYYPASQADRTYLHAWRLQLALPGLAIELACPPHQGQHFLTAEFAAALALAAGPE